jgi:pyruvate formate lyase activating enzyme
MDTILPVQVIKSAVAKGVNSISFTYSEPVLSFEYAKDFADEAKKQNIHLIFVTNGQLNPRPARELSTFISAANVDLKSFSPDSYQNILGGNLNATLNTIETFLKNGVWVEITTLLVPGMNDSAQELTETASFIARLSKDIPWHVSRFHPAYKWTNLPITPQKTMQRAINTGFDAGLKYVYAGNMGGNNFENTFCPECKNIIVDRTGYTINNVNTTLGRCNRCGHKIAGAGFP